MMFKYLLLGFVLMVSGLQVVAQSYCGDLNGYEWQAQESDDGFLVFVHIEYANQFQVYTWYNNELIDVQPTGQCEAVEEAESTTQLEQQMLTYVRGIDFGGLFSGE